MNVEAVLRSYDREQRRDIVNRSMRRDATPHVVRHVGVTEPIGVVLYSNLKAETADGAIRDQIAFFEQLGQDFEWKVFDHDQPPDLRQRLIAHGFELGDAEALLALDVRMTPPTILPPGLYDIRRITDASQLRDVLSVQETVWEQKYDDLHQRLVDDLQNDLEHLSIYVAYVDGQPASSAWIYYHEGSQFAGLWGGSTLPTYRNRGIYRALVAMRLEEARQRGVRYLTVDASPMSRPILERSGFEFLTFTYPCLWKVQREDTHNTL